MERRGVLVRSLPPRATTVVVAWIVAALIPFGVAHLLMPTSIVDVPPAAQDASVVSLLALPVPLTLTGVGPSAASLSWIPSVDLCFREYELRYADAAAGPWTTWATIPDRSTTNAFVYGFSPATSVWWRLIDRDCDGNEAPTELVVPHPEAASLSYAQVDGTTVQFSWNNNALYGGVLAFGSYQLMQSVNGGPFAVATSITDVSTTSYTLGGLSSTSGYTFYLLTTDVCSGCGDGTPPSPSVSNSVTFGAPQPVGASASASPTAVDVGQTVSFRCTASGGAAPYTYAWTFGDGASGSGQAPSHSYSQAGSMRATCTVTDSGSGQASAFVDVVVSPAPAVVASVDHPAAAPGTGLTFTADASGGPGPFPSYAWSFGDGTTGSGATVGHAYADSRTFTATVTVTDGNGGTASDTVVVSITPVTVSSSTSTTSAEPGYPIDFTGWASGGAGPPYTFAWDFGDGTTGSGETVSHSYASPGNYTPTVSADDPLDARGTSNPPTITIAEGAVPGGPLAVAFTQEPTAPTAGELVFFAAFPTGGAGGYNCSWAFGDTGGSEGCTASHAWEAQGTYNVSVTVSDRDGGRAVSQRQVTVMPRLGVTFQIAPSNPGAGQPATLTAFPVGGSGGYTCRWTFGDSPEAASGCETAHAWDEPGNYLVSILVNDSAGHRVIVVRSVDVVAPTSALASGLNPLLLIPAAVAAGIGLHVLVRRRTSREASGDAPTDTSMASDGPAHGGPPGPSGLAAIDEWLETDATQGRSTGDAGRTLTAEPGPRGRFNPRAVRRAPAAAQAIEPDSARSFLHMDPVGNAVIWDRAFQKPDYEVHGEGRPLRGLIAVRRADRRGGANFVAMHALDLDAASGLCEYLPAGFAIIHLTEEFPVTLLAHRAKEFHPRTAWLFQLDADEFVDHPDDRVRPLKPEWAGRVAKLLEPEWPADSYVRRRIEGGPTAAIYVDGEPVAWALTHIITDRVGVIGMVHVLEEHRRKGLARAVVAAVCRDLIRAGKVPALYAYTDNEASLALFPTLGFQKVKRQVWGDAVFG